MEDDQFFSISPFMIFPEVYGSFSIYLKKGKHYVLYARRGEEFTERHKATLYENGIEEVYVQTAQRINYEAYVEHHLGDVLSNETIPVPVRSRVFYQASTNIVKTTMQSKLPVPLTAQLLEKLLHVVSNSIRFLSTPHAMRAVATLLSHDYQTYTHSTNVFIYTVAILETYPKSEEDKLHWGLGALLHDIGKTLIPRNVLHKPGKLNRQEQEIFQTHPLKGMGLCSCIPLAQDTINCILFHHERSDGSGYPVGLRDPHIPLPAMVVAVADIYDTLTTRSCFAEAQQPFQALTTMREEMKEALNTDVLRRLILILSGAGIIKEELGTIGGH